MNAESIADTISEARQQNIQFLVIDSELALTFLDLAKTTWSAEKSRRLIGEAQKACETILSFVHRLRLTPDNAPVLHKNLEILIRRLRRYLPLDKDLDELLLATQSLTSSTDRTPGGMPSCLEVQIRLN